MAKKCKWGIGPVVFVEEKKKSLRWDSFSSAWHWDLGWLCVGAAAGPAGKKRTTVCLLSFLAERVSLSEVREQTIGCCSRNCDCAKQWWKEKDLAHLRGILSMPNAENEATPQRKQHCVWRLCLITRSITGLELDLMQFKTGYLRFLLRYLILLNQVWNNGCCLTESRVLINAQALPAN